MNDRLRSGIAALRGAGGPSSRRLAAAALAVVAALLVVLSSTVPFIGIVAAEENSTANDYEDGDFDHLKTTTDIKIVDIDGPTGSKSAKTYDGGGGTTVWDTNVSANYQDHYFEVYFNISSGSTNAREWRVRDSTSGDHVTTGVDASANNFYIAWNDGSAGSGTNNTAVTINEDTWYRVEQSVDNGEATARLYNANTGEELASQTISVSVSGSGKFMWKDNDQDTHIDSWDVGDRVILDGQVTSDGNAVSGATVEIFEGNARVKNATTNSTGWYSAEVDNSSTFDLKVRDTDHNDATETVTTTGSDVRQNISLDSRLEGHVRDQNGNACPNCTVEVVGVHRNNITVDVNETKIQRAKELLDRAKNPLPDSWDPNLKLGGPDGKFGDLKQHYVAIHTQEQWGLATPGPGTPDLEIPKLNPTTDDALILTEWNPRRSGIQDGVDADLPGATVDDPNITIRRIGPKGDVIDERHYDRHQTYQTLPGTHDFVKVYLNPGVYEVEPAEGGYTYTVVVGDTDDIIESFAKGLQRNAEAINSTLPQAAADFASKINDGEFWRTTKTANSSGYFSASPPSTVDVVAVSAYKIDGQALPNNYFEPSPQDLRDWIRENDYNGSVYFSTSPERIELNEHDADIRVRKFTSPPYQLLDELESRWDNWRDKLMNNSLTDLGSLFDVPFRNWTSTKTDDVADNMTDIFKNDTDLQKRWEDKSGQDWPDWYEDFQERIDDDGDQGPINDTELQEDIKQMEQTINELQSRLAAEKPEINIETNVDPPDVGGGGIDNPDQDEYDVLNYRQAFGDDFEKGDVLAIWNDYDGTSNPIPDTYITVNKRPGRGDEVVISGYPLPEGSAGGQVRVTVLSEDGELGHATEQATNPDFGGEVPDLRSIDLSSLQPGPDEEVSAEPHFEDPATTVESVEVIDPDGNTVSSTLSDGVATFTPSKSGTHFVRFTMNDSGKSFVQSFDLGVGNVSENWPESVYVKNGRLGLFALAGDKVDDADVSVSDAGTTISVDALVEPDAGTDEVHFYLSEAPNAVEQTYEFHILQGDSLDQASALSRRVGVFIHGRTLSEDGTIYRQTDDGSQPIPFDGETTGGTIEDDAKGGQVIHTYSDKTGAVSVAVDNNPGTIDRLRYRVSIFLDGTPIPTSLPDFSLSVVFVGLAGLIGRRRSLPGA